CCCADLTVLCPWRSVAPNSGRLCCRRCCWPPSREAAKPHGHHWITSPAGTRCRHFSLRLGAAKETDMARKKGPSKKKTPPRTTQRKKAPPRTAPPTRQAEPEGGPTERQREFLEERTAPLAPKGTRRPPAAGRMDTATAKTSTVPPGFRRQLIQQYRQRQ